MKKFERLENRSQAHLANYMKALLQMGGTPKTPQQKRVATIHRNRFLSVDKMATERFQNLVSAN